ncbi:MAG: amino acid ABC transporter substrate-binding protein [Desulfobacteraceae bacterium]|nr:amino acid ABC transporter substrate-binding protein [Desulfobacteraceae bacterium]
MKIGRIFRLSILLLSCGVFLLCAGPGTAGAGDREEIRIGTHLPLSGGNAASGRDQKWAYKVAVEDVNANGGIYVEEYGKKLPVKLIVLDDESDPGKATAAVERLVKQRDVDLILSGFTAPFGVIPGCIAADKYRTYYHATSCFIPVWKEHNFQWSTVFFFRMPDMASVPFKLLDSADKSKRPQKMGLLMENTFDGRSLGKVIKGQAKEFGYSFDYEETISTESKDYTSQILKAKQKGIEGLIIFGDTSQITTFVRQAKGNNLNYKFLHTIKGGWVAEFWNALGKDAQYITCDGFWSEDYPYEGASELGKRYFEDFNKHSVSIGSYYALAQILWQAIEDAGTLDSEEVRKAVIENKFDTVMGEIDYDEGGVGVFPAPGFQWMNGRQEVVYPFDLATQNLELAPPWNER